MYIFRAISAAELIADCLSPLYETRPCQSVTPSSHALEEEKKKKGDTHCIPIRTLLIKQLLSLRHRQPN